MAIDNAPTDSTGNTGNTDSSTGDVATVKQGSQPTYGGVRVGVMRVGEHQGRLKARLWLNGPDDHLRVDLAEGESQDLFGRGLLTLEAVHLPVAGGRGGVTFRFAAATPPSSPSERRPRHRAAVTGTLLALALAVAGCGGDETDPADDPAPSAAPTVSVQDAQQTWAPLVAEVADAVGEVGSVPVGTDGDPEAIYWADDLKRCVYSSLRYELDTVLGEETSWDDVRRVVADVLEPQGFEVTEQLDIPGGHNGFDAATADGTRVEVRSKTGQASTISLSAPTLGTCDLEVGETLPPLASPAG